MRSGAFAQATSTPSSGAVGFFANLPVGATTQLDTPFSLLSAGNNYGVPISGSTNASGLRLRDAGDQNRLSIIDASTGDHTDSSGTASPANIGALGTTGMSSSPYAFAGRWPTTAAFGSGPWTLMPAILTGYNKIYIGRVMMLSSNFSAAHTIGVKDLWVECDAYDGSQEKTGSDIYTSLDDSNGSSAGVKLDFQIIQQGVVIRAMGANQGGSTATLSDWMNYRGVWRQLEILLEINTDNATANGRGRVWHDGILTHDYTDVQWQGAASPRKFTHCQFEPTWGGDTGTGTRPPADMFTYVDRYLIAGID